MSKVILLGYMGSGKTEIVNELSKKGYNKVFDLDELIEAELNLSIKDIFKSKGEVFFRKKEHEILTNFLISNDEFVLGLGGGTPCYANNHLLLKEDGIDSIYLKASVETLVSRLKPDFSKRPLLKNIKEVNLEDFVAKHLFERSYFYYQAKHIVSVDQKSVNQIIGEIEKILA